MRRTLFVGFIGLAILVACGTDNDSTFGNGGADAGADGSNSNVPPSLLGGDDGGDGTTLNCSSKIICGGKCCQGGEECFDSACVTACASGVHCGATCCGTGDVCLAQACVTPGKACVDSFDCEETEFCEPTVNKCLPQPPTNSLCQYKPPVLPFAPTLEWSWTGSTILPAFNQVINTAIVIDLDGDTFPEVIIVTSKDTDAFGQGDPAYLRVLDGRTGAEKWTDPSIDAYQDLYQVNPRGTPAAADLDGDGNVSIVVPRKGGGLLMFDKNGHVTHESTDTNGTTAYKPVLNSVTVAIADMDLDGHAEIVAGGLVFDSTLKLTNAAHKGHEAYGANDASYGAVSIVAAIRPTDPLPFQYVVSGNRAIAKDGSVVWDVSTPAFGSLTDGYPAIADLDGDGTPELVVIAQGKVRVQNALTGELIAQLALPGSGKGGPPTIADFDGDGHMEISSANGTSYNVFEYDASQPAGSKLSVKWTAATQDGSSNVTGSSVFDFEGDGTAEIVYNDECYSRVYRGVEGQSQLTEVFKIANSSATIHEMPVLVDVDGDNNTEFVVVANDRNHILGGLTCPGYGVGVEPRHGVFVYGDSNDKWVRTRRIWNQHAYHITNVLADGKIPNPETKSFTTSANNDYRVSSQGKGVFNAPDLKVDLEVSTESCPASIDLVARVRNGGSLGVKAGVDVKFYAGTDASTTPIASKKTTRALLPGESETIVVPLPVAQINSGSFFVTVDGGDVGGVTVNECLTDNNSGTATSVRCPGVN